ncbi:MAG: RagB/SusD family nutrient uptake outer membrane protein [Tannerellaceae bacterium]|nr:RagB/SusD family nutrient uptake outer membrane protein [Tannerellaceae bacterium]
MERKNYMKAFSLIASLFFMFGCVDMDLNPADSIYTQDQKDDLLNSSPDRLVADVNGLYSGLIKYASIYNWANATRHFDFGYAAACMIFDSSGMDMPAENSGYNWFLTPARFLDRTKTNEFGYFLWLLFYSHMRTANDILATIPSGVEDATLKAYRGQALASRAFDYLNLVQMYQFTYVGHENELAIPLVDENTSGQDATENGRATVKEIYDLIISDLNEAIEILEGYSRTNKGLINQNVAYGLRARAHLLMNNWDQAASDAANALSGYTPYSIEEVSKPSFNDISAGSWIWGLVVSETNDIVRSGLLNFPSHMCSFTGNGYAPGYAGRYINNTLWEQIPETDVRKGWWIDENFYSPIVDYDWTATYNGVEYGVEDWFGWQAPYLNVKFGPYQDIYDNATNACDFPMMRAEEMYLIMAEAQAMGGNPGTAKSTLESFIRTYRDPAYVCPASDAAGIREEVWFQRRVELWGEGFSFFDMMRLKKPLKRTGTNFDAQLSYDLPAESDIFLWIIPEEEENTNTSIINNPVMTTPTPVSATPTAATVK